MLAINKRLNLVIPLAREDGTTLYVHSTPLPSEIFETYYMVLAKTWTEFANNGLNHVSAPKIAYYSLLNAARNTQRAPGMTWDQGPDGVSGEGGLIAHILRMSRIITTNGKSDKGAMLLTQAIDDGLIDDDEKREVLSILTFFTVVCHAAPREMGKAFLAAVAQLWELQLTSSNATEYAISLRTSTTDANTGAKDPA